MSFLAELDDEAEARRNRHRKIIDIIEAEGAEFEEALTARNGSYYKYSAPAIVAVLKRKNYDISASSIRNFRNGTS